MKRPWPVAVAVALALVPTVRGGGGDGVGWACALAGLGGAVGWVVAPGLWAVSAAALAVGSLGVAAAVGAPLPMGMGGAPPAAGLSTAAALPVAALSAWAVGALLGALGEARRAGVEGGGERDGGGAGVDRGPSAEGVAWECLVGAVAACFLLAAGAKARDLGWEWVDPRRMGALLAERAAAGGPLAGLRAGLAASPWASAALAWALGVFEASGVLLLPRGARRPVAALLLVGYGAASLVAGTWSASWAAVLLALVLVPAGPPGPVGRAPR